MAFNAKVKEIIKDINAIQILVKCAQNAAPSDPSAEEGIKDVDAVAINKEIDEFVKYGEVL